VATRLRARGAAAFAREAGVVRVRPVTA